MTFSENFFCPGEKKNYVYIKENLTVNPIYSEFHLGREIPEKCNKFKNVIPNIGLGGCTYMVIHKQTRTHQHLLTFVL